MADPASITLVRKDLSTVSYSPPRQYYVVRQDDQIDPSLYIRPGLNRPMVFRLETYLTFPMTEHVQRFLRELNPTTTNDQFADLWDTWATNSGKIRDNANYITGERLDRPDPRWSYLYMGRNALCGEEVIADGSFAIKAGTPCLKVETLDPDNLPAGLTYKTHPHLIHHCNIITDHKVDGLYQVNPFLTARTTPPYQPVLYGLMTKTTVYVPMWMLIKHPLGTPLPSPYHPA